MLNDIKCPFCDTQMNNFQLGENKGELIPVFAPLLNQEVGKPSPVASIKTLVCDKCGYVALFTIVKKD